MAKTSPEKRHMVLYHLQNGRTIHSVAQLLGIAKSTVHHIGKSAPTEVPKSKGGRPKKLQPCHLCFLDHYFKLNCTTTVRNACQALQETFDVKVCPTTIRKVLQFCQFKARKMVKQPFLRKKHIKDCLKFAHRYKNWTVEDWKKVIWSDKTKINFIGPDGKQRCWVKAAGFSSKLVKPTVKFGSSPIMLWGCMTWEGVGGMHMVLGRMDSVQYINILDEKLLQTMSGLHHKYSYHDLIFQQDGNPKHTSKRTKVWLQSKSINTMEWPAQSPDLNPIEHLWQVLKKQLSQYTTIAKSESELLQHCEAEWTAITPEVCQNLIENMPRQVQAVIKAKGGNTKY
ncbi:related to transposase [Sporisorium reilianum f. sp. reilianum]|uniref:Related to transposase n=1 Tax=Sporisorium reilianum f. sp. reilianum TaxID=72559 RepID=A0A2N8UCT8_9BASI|nr:related to transposase [Sporisorium reilianum f. sp. reilianum]